MAARNEDLELETGRYLCRVRKGNKRKGYRKDILTDNLSERDTVFFCIRCQGMMREACLSSDGEQLCSCCKKEGEQTNPNLHVSNMILSFKCSCPLMVRGCGWLGTLGNCEDHLDTCGYVYETCEIGCGVVQQRNELDVHEMEKCPQRIVECKHCNNEFKSCELHTHLDKCPKMEVSCELKYGKIMCREDMTQHLKQDCGLMVEMCKLGCGKEMTRNELRIHMTDTCVQRLIQCKHCKGDFKFCDMSAHLDVCPKMEVSCELKCGKIMCREDMTQHLKQDCGLMVEMCKLGCGKEMTRNELRIHVTDTCVQRLIQCEHCKRDFKFCDMSAHLDVCPKMEVSCELKCGVVMCREVMTQHLEVDCPEKAIECSYAKYKCVGLIKRKDMSKHLEERRMEHLELKLNDFIMESSKESEINAKQNEKISEQSATIATMSQKIESLEKEVKILTDLTVSRILSSNSIKLEWITKLPERYCHIYKQFLIAGYQFEFDFHRNYFYFNQLHIQIKPQNGFYYEKLKCPFKAEFTTRLRSKRNPSVTKEFKSEVIIVEREDFNSDFKKYFNIVTISYYEYKDVESDYLTDGVAEFEIFVDIL